MAKEININELSGKLNAQLEARKKELYDKYLECKQELIDNTDKSKVEDLIDIYEYISEKNTSITKFDFKSHITAAKLFNIMANGISYEFDTTVVDTDNFTISFVWPGRSINWPVKMLAAKYNLHSCGFGFDSSFTTHEALTEDNYRLRIGIDSEDNSRVLISFGKLNELKFY